MLCLCRAGAVRGPPVSKKRRRQAAAEDLEKRQLAAKARRKKAAEKSRSALLACSADTSSPSSSGLTAASSHEFVKGAAPRTRCFLVCSCLLNNYSKAIPAERDKFPCTSLVSWVLKLPRTGSQTLHWFRRAAGLPLGYDSSQRVLLVGEGNFSFARALLRLFGGQGSGVVATAFDTEAAVLEKYDVSLRRSPALGTVRQSAGAIAAIGLGRV